MVLVRYKVFWVDNQTVIEDEFLWPVCQRSLKQMKMFAIDYLSDILQAKNIKFYQASQVAAFANFVAYIINREIELVDKLNHYSIESMVRDGVFGNGAGIDYGEHLMQIHLRIGDYSEAIQWDICNPDNQPEDFATSLVNDLQLQPVVPWTQAISFEIRKQILMYCC